MKGRRGIFIVAMVLTVAIATSVSVAGASGSGILGPVQQASAVGGDACEFAGGFALGLGVAGLFGCVVCGGGALVLGAARFLMC